MKQVFQKIASLLMAFVVLFSTMSFTIDMHYCGDELVDTSIFDDANFCGMDSQALTSNCETVKGECCTDIHLKKDSQDKIKYTVDTVSFNQELIAVSFIYSYINLFEGLKENVIPFQDYTPPLVIKNIQLLDETFLI